MAVRILNQAEVDRIDTSRRKKYSRDRRSRSRSQSRRNDNSKKSSRRKHSHSRSRSRSGSRSRRNKANERRGEEEKKSGRNSSRETNRRTKYSRRHSRSATRSRSSDSGGGGRRLRYRDRTRGDSRPNQERSPSRPRSSLSPSPLRKTLGACKLCKSFAPCEHRPPRSMYEYYCPCDPCRSQELSTPPTAQLVNISWTAPRSTSLHADLLHLQQWLAPTHRDREAHQYILQKLQGIVKAKYSNATLSIASCSPPDTDMFLDDVRIRVALSSGERNFGSWLKDALHSSRWAHKVESYFSTNNPYLSFIDRETAIPVEVAFGSHDFWSVASPLEGAYRLLEFAPVLCAVKIILAQKSIFKTFSNVGHVQAGAIVAEYLLRAKKINPVDTGTSLRNLARWILLDFVPDPHKVTVGSQHILFAGFKKIAELKIFLEQAMAADLSLGTAIQRGDMRLSCWLDLQSLTKARLIKAHLIESALPSKTPTSVAEFEDDED